MPEGKITDKEICEVEKRYSQIVQEAKAKKQEEKIKVSWIDLLLTEQCNFNCDYCYVKQSGKEMTLDTAKKAIDWAKSFGGERIIVNLFGGEPFLAKELILQIIDYVKDDSRIALMCSTNGSIYDEELVNALLSNKFHMQISMDGVKEAQEAHRGNFEQVYKNARKFLAKKNDISVRPTITPKTAPYLEESIRLFYEMGFGGVSAQCLISGVWSDYDLAEYRKQYKQVANFYLELLKDNRHFRIKFLEDTIKRILSAGTRLYPCEAGRTLFAISAEGSIYPCHRFYRHTQFKLGNIFDKDFSRGIFSRIYQNNIVGCEKCVCLEACHICLAANFDETKDILLPPAQYCKLIKIEYEEALRVIEVGRKIPAFNKLFGQTDSAIEQRLERIENILIKLSQVVLDMSESLGNKS